MARARKQTADTPAPAEGEPAPEAKPKRAKKADAPAPTTAGRLASLLKTARDTMRKDKGLNGDLDRLPLLTWLMFLKFLDDKEAEEESRAKLARKPYQPTIEAPYRWRDWATPDTLTGDDLLRFISSESLKKPDDTEYPGLIRALRSYSGSADPRRQVVGRVFDGVSNRMESGYLLRQILAQINGIHFTSSEEISTLGHLYESLLKEMRDAAGDSGEFYTPRAVVRFMVAATNPKLGETVLDPAAGTGGFLVETFAHLKAQAKKATDIATLQQGSIFGTEAKPMPYMLCQMNLLLHGLDAPAIEKANSLNRRIADIGDGDRVDVILTNPPFGGEEEKGIQNNFPTDKQTAETALLFLQLIMRLLRRNPAGRAAVVVPNGTLSGDGVCGRIKQELLTNFNLHTIVRLPEGVFSPYTDIATNLLFFDRGEPSTDVWYYQIPLPEGRRKYTKTVPMQFDEFGECLRWWKDRIENERAWKVPAAELIAAGCNLDQNHPHPSSLRDPRSPAELSATIRTSYELIEQSLKTIHSLLTGYALRLANAPRRKLGEIAPLTRRPAVIDPQAEYPQVSARSFGRGTFHSPPLKGSEITWEKPHLVKAGDILVSNIKAWEGAIAVAGPEDDGRFGSHRYLTFVPVQDVATARYVCLYLLSEEGLRQVGAASPGSADRNRTLNAKRMLEIEIPLPPVEVQQWFATIWENTTAISRLQAESLAFGERLAKSIFERAFAGEI